MNKICFMVIITTVLIGCSLNVEDSERSITTSKPKGAITGIKIKKDYSSSGNISITGNALSDTINISAKVSQLILRNESPSEVILTLKDIGNNNRLVGFTSVSGSWQGVSVGDISSILPAEINLDLESSSGDIYVQQMSGTVYAEAHSGNVDISTENYVDIEASSGDVMVYNVKGCRVDASSGDVTVNSVGGVRVSASSGNVDIKTVLACTTYVSSGDTFIGILRDTITFGGILAESSSGDVIIGLPFDFSAWLDLKTSSGDISVNGTNKGDSYKGALNDGNFGSRMIKVDCSSGDVRVFEFN